MKTALVSLLVFLCSTLGSNVFANPMQSEKTQNLIRLVESSSGGQLQSHLLERGKNLVLQAHLESLVSGETKSFTCQFSLLEGFKTTLAKILEQTEYLRPGTSEQVIDDLTRFALSER